MMHVDTEQLERTLRKKRTEMKCLEEMVRPEQLVLDNFGLRSNIHNYLQVYLKAVKGSFSETKAYVLDIIKYSPSYDVVMNEICHIWQGVFADIYPYSLDLYYCLLSHSSIPISAICQSEIARSLRIALDRFPKQRFSTCQCLAYSYIATENDVFLEVWSDLLGSKDETYYQQVFLLAELFKEDRIDSPKSVFEQSLKVQEREAFVGHSQAFPLPVID